jgi:hypothetical protein
MRSFFFAYAFCDLFNTLQRVHMNDPPKPPSSDKPPTFWQMLHSVMAAAFGVQSGKNRERDFTHGKPVHFVMLGLLVTIIFAAALFGIVQLVMHFAVR